MWDIPISPSQTSVGLVLPGDVVRARRQSGRSAAAILRDELSRHMRTYSQHVFRLGHSFNAHIENAIYRHPVRWGLGLQAATYIYTFFAFFMDALHARFDPRGWLACTSSVCCFSRRVDGSVDGRPSRGWCSGAGAYTARGDGSAAGMLAARSACSACRSW